MTNEKKTITKEELSSYIPLREVYLVILPDDNGESRERELSASILVSPDIFDNPEEFLKLRVDDFFPEYPPSFYLLERVEEISTEREYRTLTKEERGIIIQYYRGKRSPGKVDILEEKIPKVYKTSRKLSFQMTRPRKKGQDLFSLLPEDNKRELRQMISSGEKRLLSPVTSGLVLSAVQNKIVKALGMYLYAQSRPYEKESPEYEGRGVPKEIVSPLVRGEYDEDFSYIVVEPYKFTRDVLGRDEIGGKDVQLVTAGLADLDGKFYWDEEEKSFFRLLTIERIKPFEKNESGQILLALRPVFRDNLEKRFINSRGDELKLLSGISSTIALRLFDVLKEMISYDLPTTQKWGYFKMKEEELLERVAVGLSYDKNPKRKRTDFESAIKEMQRIGIITKCVRVGKNLHFFPGEDWTPGREGASGKRKGDPSRVGE